MNESKRFARFASVLAVWSDLHGVPPFNPTRWKVVLALRGLYPRIAMLPSIILIGVLALERRFWQGYFERRRGER